MPKKCMAKLLLLSVLCLLVLPSWGAGELKVLAHDFAPYSWREKSMPQGYAYELVQQIMQEMHEKAPIKFVSFRRAEMEVQKHGWVVVFPYARTPERENTVKWVGPIAEMSVYMFKRKGENIRLERLEDLHRVRSIGIQHSIVDDIFLSKQGLNNLFRMENKSQTVRALLNRRVEVIPLDVLGLNQFLREEKIQPNAIESTGLKLFNNSLYIAFSRDVSDATIARWQQALDKVNAAPHLVMARKNIN